MSYESKTWYKNGSWNVHCDVCNFKFKSEDIRKRWDGLMVCDADFELDHPQKFLRVKGDKISVPYVRKQEDVFLDVCYLWEISSYADIASADCAKADNQSFPYTFLLNLKTEGTTN